MSARCKHTLYVEGSTVPDKVIRCWRTSGHASPHRTVFYFWTDEESFAW